jgi:uncharacterized protein YjbJ (UPF0337 family)
MNDNLISGKWNEIKGDIKNAWGKLSDDEIEKAKGNIQSLAGTIQQKFGLAQEEAAAKLNRIVEKYKNENKEDLDDEKNTSGDTYSS